MEHDTWDVYFADGCIAKDMDIEDATLLIEALTQRYTEDLRITGARVSVVYHKMGAEE